MKSRGGIPSDIGSPAPTAPYEAPVAPEVIVDTDRQMPEEAAEVVLASLPFVQSTTHPAVRSLSDDHRGTS
jgi:adenylylsulfate kinase-like enzyme